MDKEKKVDIGEIDLDRSKYEFKDEDVSIFKTPKGLSEDIVREISAQKTFLAGGHRRRSDSGAGPGRMVREYAVGKRGGKCGPQVRLGGPGAV